MIVLIDTDVLIDIALDREPHAEAAGGLVDAIQARSATGFVAWHTVSNFYYLVSPSRGADGARSFLADLAAFVGISPTTTTSLELAFKLNMQDFEDALQVAAAIACRADVIATRNLRDYRNAPVSASSPHALLEKLN